MKTPDWMNPPRVAGLKLVAPALVFGFILGSLVVGGRYQVQPAPTSPAYVLRSDRVTGATKAIPVDFSALAAPSPTFPLANSNR